MSVTDGLHALEGFLTNAEGEMLAELAMRVPVGQAIVELGSYRGRSTAFLAAGARDGVQVHAVDLWSLGGQWEDTAGQRATEAGGGVPQQHSDPAHYEAFRRQTARFAHKIVEHHAETAETGKVWHGLLVGLLFVDADHSYLGVTGDLEAWAPKLAPRAVVCCHDYTNLDYPGVGRAVDDWIGQRDEDGIPPAAFEVVDSMAVIRL